MTELMCEFCGAPAYFVSKYAGIPRCEKNVNHCSGFRRRQQEGRALRAKANPEALRERMRSLSKRGNERLQELHQDPDWVALKGRHISEAIAKNGGRGGSRNPRFNKPHSDETRARMRASAAMRDNSNIGRYVRTPKHRETLSIQMIDRVQRGTLRRTTNTKPERALAALLVDLGVAYSQQFLIQYGSTKDGTRFRHCYDFHITGTNILIEVDGDYWHTRPEVIARDRACEAVALERGFQVIRITESDLKDLDSVRQRVLTLVGR